MYGMDFELKGCDVTLDGLKIGVVVENSDPTAQEKVLVRVIGVHDMKNTDPNYGVIARHCAFSKGTSGEIPEIGDYLYVMFINGDPNQCVWIGFVRHAG